MASPSISTGRLARLAIACALLLAPRALGSEVDDVLAHLIKHRKAAYQDLIELASIPSVSSIPSYSDDCLRAAQWLHRRLKAAGLENAEILPTGAPTHQPVVYADWLHAGAGQPTVLLYGHYDVQPAEDTELWERPPFEAHLKDGYFYGRGVDDDKGGIVPAIQVLEAYLKVVGRLPVNVKLLLEGQEEIGSPHLAAFLQKHAARFAADFSLSVDGGQDSAEQGILALALRGATAFEVEVRTLAQDLHSGTFGGTVQNANHVLATLIAGLHFPNGSVAIPGFYQGVRPITAEDKQDMADFSVFSEADHLQRAGATAAVGEEGFSTLERTWHRPTCDVVGQHGGFTGQGVKTIVPGKAVAKVACRLVPDQDPEHVLKLAERWVQQQAIPGAQLTFTSLHWAAPPYVMPKDVLPNRAAAKVLEQLLGRKPLYYRVGGSIPAAAFMQTYLGITTTMFGFGLPSNNIHAPNERYGLDEFHRAHEGYTRILHEIAVMTNASSSSGSGSSRSAASQRPADEL